jgi:hypothetical protein
VRARSAVQEPGLWGPIGLALVLAWLRSAPIWSPGVWPYLPSATLVVVIPLALDGRGRGLVHCFLVALFEGVLLGEVWEPVVLGGAGYLTLSILSQALPSDAQGLRALVVLGVCLGAEMTAPLLMGWGGLRWFGPVSLVVRAAVTAALGLVLMGAAAAERPRVGIGGLP